MRISTPILLRTALLTTTVLLAGSPLMPLAAESSGTQRVSGNIAVAADEYEVEVDVVNVRPLLVREQVFEPERVCRQAPVRRSDGYSNRPQRYHNPNHRGHSEECYSTNSRRGAGFDRGGGGYRCYTIERERVIERIDGYEVTYVYNGQELTKRLAYDPGSRLRIRIQAQPQVSSFGRKPLAEPNRRPSLSL